MNLSSGNLSISQQILALCAGFFILAVVNFFVINHLKENLSDNNGEVNVIRNLDNLSHQLALQSKSYIQGDETSKESLEKTSEDFKKNLKIILFEDPIASAGDTTVIPESDDDILSIINLQWANTQPHIENLILEPLTMDTIVLESREVPLNDSLNSYTTETSQKILKVTNTKVLRSNNFIQKASSKLSVQLKDLLAQKIQDNEDQQNNFTYVLLLFLLLDASAVIIILLFIQKQVLEPLNQISKSAEKVGQGDLSASYDYPYNNEIGKTLASIDQITVNLKNATSFVNRIEKGQLDVKFEGLDEQKVNFQTLEGALINMREQMKKVEEEDKERKWTTEGLAKFVDILRANDDNVSDLGDEIISNLVKYTNSNQGGLYILKSGEEKEVLELISLYAFNTKKYENRIYRPGEGLVGQTFQEKETIYLMEIPHDYITITSGLGGANPKSILLVPLKINEDIYGVIELASFNKYKNYEIEFVEKLGESIASTIAGVNNNQKTRKLLEESQGLAEQMQAQEEEMRQNMEELQATQDQLERQMKENSGMQEDLIKEKALLDALMNHLPDYIFFKDLDSKFIRISKSMEKLFPYSLEEMVGKSDFDFHTKGAAEQFYDEEQQIIKTGNGFTNNLVHEIIENGLDQWVLTTKLPFFDKNGHCLGTFGTSKDVTQVRDQFTGSGSVDESKYMTDLENALRQNLEELEITQEQLDKKLRKSESTLEVIDSIVKIISVNKNNQITHITSAVEVMLQIEKNEVINQDITILTDEITLTDIRWNQVEIKDIQLRIKSDQVKVRVNIYANKAMGQVHFIWV